MPTVEELGQRVKAKYPEYADMSDAIVGQKVKAKFPGQYDDFSDLSRHPAALANQALSGTGITVSSPGLRLPRDGGGPIALREPSDSLPASGAPGWIQDDKSGKPRPLTEKDESGGDDPLSHAMDMPYNGVKQVIRGVQAMSHPSMERKAHGLHEALGGAVQAATPFAAPAMLANPVTSLVGLGVGTGVQQGIQKGAEALKVPEGYSELAGDVAGLGAGALAAKAVPGSAVALKKSAAKNYESVLLPKSEKLVPKAEETAALMAEKKPIAMTRESLLEKVRANKQLAGPPAGAAYEGKPPVPGSAQAGIFDALDRLEARHVKVKGSDVEVNPNLKEAIGGLRQKLIAMKDDLGNIPAATLDDFRDKLYRGDVDAMGNIRANAPATAKAIEKSTASSIRRVLDDNYPDSKKLNDNFKLWANAEDFLESARRREKSAKSGIVTGSSQGFGALAQRMLPRPVREIPGKILGFFDSVAWNTVSGATKQRLAEAIAGENWGIANDILSEAQAASNVPAVRRPPMATPMPVINTEPKLLGPGHPAAYGAQNRQQ